MVDTNSDPSNIDYIIPANDDASKSIELIAGALVAAMAEGLEERKAEKLDNEAAEGEAAAAPRRERRRVRRNDAPAAEGEEAAAEEAPVAEAPAAE